MCSACGSTVSAANTFSTGSSWPFRECWGQSNQEKNHTFLKSDDSRCVKCQGEQEGRSGPTHSLNQCTDSTRIEHLEILF